MFMGNILDNQVPLVGKDEGSVKSKIHSQPVDYKLVLLNLLPNIANSIMYYFIGLVETHFIGKTQDITLMDGVGLGILYNNVIVYFLGIGLVESMAVTLPKAFGKKDFKLLGTQTNQVRVIISIFFFIFIFINLFFSKDILYLISGADKSYVEIAHKYVLYTTPALFLDLQFEIYAKYTEAHLNYDPVVYSFILSCASNVLSCYYFISVMDLGVLGCGIAFNITNIVKIMTIYICITKYNPFPQSNFFFNKKTFEWKSFSYMLKVSILSMITYFAECAGFSISNIVANKFSKISYAKYLVLSNISMINYSMCYGWMNTTSILVSNYIGENSPKKVMLSIKYLATLGIIVEIPLIFSFYYYRDSYFYFFSETELIYKSPDMRNYYIYLLIIFNVLDFLQAFLVGILRGCEILNLTTTVSFIFFLIFHPIMSTTLSIYYEMDINGILISELMVYTILALTWSFYFIFKLDIERICEKYKEDQDNKDETPVLSRINSISEN